MIVTNANKRKSFENQNGGPQSAKKPKLNKAPNKQMQTTPPSQNKKQGGKKPNLKMFAGTANLEQVSVKKEPFIKSEPGSIKKEPGSGKKRQHSARQASAGREKGQNAIAKKQNKTAGTEAPQAEGEKLSRHARRRLQRKHKRAEARGKERDLHSRIAQGDAAARREVEERVRFLENLPEKSRTCQKKIGYLTRMLKGDPSRPWRKEKPGKAEGQVKKEPAVKKEKLKAVMKAEPESDSSEAEDDSSEEQTNENEDDEEASSEEADNKEASEEDEDSEEESEDDSEEESEEDKDEKIKVENKTPKPKQQVTNKNKIIKQVPNAASPNTNDATGKAKSRYVVFVGNLPYSVTKDELMVHFKQVGEISDIRIPQSNDKPKGFAYVEVKDQASYEKALTLHHTFVGGRRINVLYTQGGNKNSPKKKQEIKAKNFKLQAMRKEGQLGGSGKADQKRSVRRAKKRQHEKNN